MKAFRRMLLIAGIVGLSLIAGIIVTTQTKNLFVHGHGYSIAIYRTCLAWGANGVDSPWAYKLDTYEGFHDGDWWVYFMLPRGYVKMNGKPVPGMILPWWFVLLCWELPLGLVYLWTLRFRKYERRRQRLAEWRASQKGFPVMVSPAGQAPPDSDPGAK